MNADRFLPVVFAAILIAMAKKKKTVALKRARHYRHAVDTLYQSADKKLNAHVTLENLVFDYETSYLFWERHMARHRKLL